MNSQIPCRKFFIKENTYLLVIKITLKKIEHNLYQEIFSNEFQKRGISIQRKNLKHY
jgi:hypothetical protein